MRAFKTIFSAFALTLLAGCARYSVECELVVQPYVMVSAGSDTHTPGYMIRVYAFYLEKAQEYLEDPDWRPESYADAEAGLIRHISTGKVRAHNLVGYQDWAVGEEPDDETGDGDGGETGEESGDTDPDGNGEEEGDGETGGSPDVASGGNGFVRLTLTKSPLLLVAVDPINKFYAWRLFKYEAPIERIYVPVSFKIYQRDPYEENEWRVTSLENEQRPAQQEEGEE